MWREVLLLLVLAVLAVWDYKKRTVNLYLIVAAGVTGCFLEAVFGCFDVQDLLMGVGIGAAVFLLSFFVKGSIGTGDGAVLMFCGLFLGFEKNLELFVTAMYFAGITAMILFVTKKRGRKYKMPFVPFLLVAYVWILL